MNVTEVVLYDYIRSTASFRVRIALEYKSIPYVLKEVHLLKDGGMQHQTEYQSVNPFALVPTLKIGEQTIRQSLAIMQYLEGYKASPALFPGDLHLKSNILAFCYDIACDLHPLNNLRVLQYLENHLRVDPHQKMDWYYHWLTCCFNGIAQVLKEHSGAYCFADTFTAADILLIAQVYNAVRFEFDLTPYPIIQDLYEKGCALPFVKSVHPSSN